MGLYPFCSGNTLGKPSAGYIFKVGSCQFCSHGNPVTLSTQLWSYLIILSDTHTTILWPVAYFSSSMLATMGWQLCLSWNPLYSCHSQRCHCWSGTGKVSLLFFHDVRVIWRKGAQIFTANAALQNHNLGTATSWQGSKWFKYEMCSAKKWSCKVVGGHQFSQGDPVLCCVWEALLCWLLIQHVMASGIMFEFEASHQTVVNLMGLGPVLLLPIARVRLLKL